VFSRKAALQAFIFRKALRRQSFQNHLLFRTPACATRFKGAYPALSG